MKPFLTNKGAKDGSSIVIRTEDSIETNPKEVANRINNFYVKIATEVTRIIYLSARPISKITPALRTLPTALEKVISLSNTLMLAPWRR